MFAGYKVSSGTRRKKGKSDAYSYATSETPREKRFCEGKRAGRGHGQEQEWATKQYKGWPIP